MTIYELKRWCEDRGISEDHEIDFVFKGEDEEQAIKLDHIRQYHKDDGDVWEPDLVFVAA